MRSIFLTVVLFAFSGLSAKEVSLSLKSIDSTLSVIAPHAQDFPPRFSSVAERRTIETQLRELLVMLDAAVAQYPDNPELLFRDGFANAMGHNLDFEGCAQKYFKAFDRLLELKPDDRRANFYYGAFLSATAARQKDSIAYLEKALALGVTDAHYTLAFVYLSITIAGICDLNSSLYVSAVVEQIVQDVVENIGAAARNKHSRGYSPDYSLVIGFNDGILDCEDWPSLLDLHSRVSGWFHELFLVGIHGIVVVPKPSQAQPAMPPEIRVRKRGQILGL